MFLFLQSLNTHLETQVVKECQDLILGNLTR